MKTSLKFLMVAAFLFVGMSASAQQKLGYTNANELATSMPEWATAQKDLETYGADLESQYNALMNELTTKQTDYQKKAATYSDVIRQQMEKELNDLRGRLQEFNQAAQEDMGRKQQELLQPIQEKLNAAIEAVAKENGFSFIFDLQSALYINPATGNDITPLVKKKLGI